MACSTEDINRAVSSTFDEFQLSLSAKEILHPSEECHRQRWCDSCSEIFDVVNSYHVFCRLCKKHLYSRSVPSDINSFFEAHVNTEYHREFRESPFSRWKEMLAWEEKWKTGKCNVCQMSGLVAFVKDFDYSPEVLFSKHLCFSGSVVDMSNLEFLRKISLLKKFCKLSIFKEKFIKPLEEGSACMLCCSKIPWSGKNVEIHLGSDSHWNQFSQLIWHACNLSPKDLLNGFNLEKVIRWISCSFVAPSKELQPHYDRYRQECQVISNDSTSSEVGLSTDHYCPEVIEKILAYEPSDFTCEGMCLLCQLPSDNVHFSSEYHKNKSKNLSLESFDGFSHYEAVCANRAKRLRQYAKTIEKYKRLQEGKIFFKPKVAVKKGIQTTVKNFFFSKTARVQKPISKFFNGSYVCEICDLEIPASFAVNHSTDFRHLYLCTKWQELKQSAANKRFFEPFQTLGQKVICLLCGVHINLLSFFSHLKETLHAKRFEWYCTLKNEVPISSAIEVKPDWSVVCYLCDSLLSENMLEKSLRTNQVILKHWPCPLVTNLGKETEEPFNANKDVKRACLTCEGTQGAHRSNCPTNSIDFRSVENTIKNIVDAYECNILERVFIKAKSAVIFRKTLDEKRQEEAGACEKPRLQSRCENLYSDFGRPEADERKCQTNHLQNEKILQKAEYSEIDIEKEEEILVVSGLRKFQKKFELEWKLSRFGKIRDMQSEKKLVKVVFVERGVAGKVASGKNLFPYNHPPVNMTVELRKVSETNSKNNTTAKCAEKTKFRPLSPELLYVLENPWTLFHFVANLTESASILSKSVRELEREKLVCATINSAVVDLFPLCRCYPFGSRLSGLMFNDSDIDVFLDCGGMYDGMQNTSRSAQQKLIKRVGKALRKKREVARIGIVARARVPIITFYHTPTGLHCDLSLKSALSVHKTLLVKHLVSLNYEVKFVIMFLKFWVKYNGIHGPPFFSSHAIAMMAVFYLQQLNPPILPTVEELQNAFVGRRLTIEGWDCNFNEDSKGFVKKGNYYPLQVILQGFFTYYANFDYDKFVISPLDGKPLPREAFSSNGQAKLPMCYKRHILHFPVPLKDLVCQEKPICVIDPFDLSHVLTKNFTQTGLEKFKHVCHASAKALKKGVLGVTFSNNLNKFD